MRQIAFVTYHKAPRLTPDDALAVKPLEELGISVTPAIWNDAAVNWKKFDAVIVRSCWDYHHHPRQFRQWLEHLQAQQITLWNPAEIIHWNMHKKYLRDLVSKGAVIPQTLWLEAGAEVNLLSLLNENNITQAVIKPVISATAYQTYRTSPATAKKDQLLLNEMLQHTGAIVQEFIDEIIVTGEWSLIFFAGKFSHAVLKRPQTGDFRVQADFGGTYHPASPSAELIQQAAAILRLVERPLLYARIDGVYQNHQFLLMELELIEPQLFFNMHNAAPRTFAAALAAMV